MEKNSEYLTWMMKRKQQVKPKLNQSSSSMEDDDDKVLTWPPRSYSCSFCKREFRSAQALGGHMNVHRRDRAKLKQSNNAANITATAPSPAPTIFFHENYYSGGDHQKGCNNKRQRIKTVSFMPVVHEPCLSSHKNSGVEEINLWVTREIRNHYPTEEIDLELRVGICRAS